MQKSIFRVLKETAAERIDEIVNGIALRNKAYKELSAEASDAFLAVSRSLPVQGKESLNEYQDAVEQRESITIQNVYCQGLLDGIQVSNLFNEVQSRDIGALKRLLGK